MKKLTIFFFLFLVSCADRNFRNIKYVESKELPAWNPSSEISVTALSELVKLYENSDKTKRNYEVYSGRTLGWNWHPESQYLFVSFDLCGWQAAYSGITLEKLKQEVIRTKDYIQKETITYEYDIGFTRVKDYNKKVELVKKYLMTNICDSGRSTDS